MRGGKTLPTYSIASLLTFIFASALLLGFRFDIFGYPRLSVEGYSPKLVQKELDDGKCVVVVVRSNLAPWSNNDLNSSQALKKAVFHKQAVVLELEWSWDNPKRVKPIFDRLGFSKEVFFAVYHPKRDTVRIDFVSSQSIDKVAKLCEKTETGPPS